MKRSLLFIACAALVLGGVTLTAPKSASAGGISISFGRSYRYNRGYSRYSNRNYGLFNRGYNYGNYGRSYYSQYRSPRYVKYPRYNYCPPTIYRR